MDYLYSLIGGTPALRRYQVDQDFDNAGVPVLESASGESGVDLATTTGFANVIGVSEDAASKLTAQQSVGTTAASLLTVNISPLSVYGARLSGDATTGTALSISTVSTASADGLSVVVDTDPNSPDLADGVVWGYSGANVGQYRKITATAANDATVEIPFDNDLAVGDTFLMANRYEADVAGITLTSDLREVDAQAAEATTGVIRVVEMFLKDRSGQGTLKSFFALQFADHAFSGAS